MNQPIFKIINPNANLYDRIIYAIQKEKETQKIKKLMILFITMFCFSCSFTVASIVLFVKSFKNSGISDIVSTAFYDLSAFIFLWKYFVLAFIENLPIFSIILFVSCLAFTIFSLRLILYKKYLLIKTILK